jgi:hypothetical protein
MTEEYRRVAGVEPTLQLSRLGAPGLPLVNRTHCRGQGNAGAKLPPGCRGETA